MSTEYLERAWIRTSEEAGRLSERNVHRMYPEPILVLDASWPRDRFAKALERALADGHLNGLTERRKKKPREARLEDRLDELGF